MTEPELLASGPERRRRPGVRRATPVVVALALLVGVVVAVTHSQRHHHHEHIAARPAVTPAALPSTGPAPAAAPVAADVARAVLDPARHRLRLIFTLYNAESTPVVLLRAGGDSAGLALRRASFARFAAGGSWHRARLPLVLGSAQSAHITLDYGVRRCPPATAARLRVPAVLTARDHGRVALDLAELVPPRDWPRGLINVLCPVSSR